MSPPTLSTLLLAVDPIIWSFPVWKARTGNIVPPFVDCDTANPASTNLQSWQLTLIRKYAKKIHTLPSFDNHVYCIYQTQKPDSKLHVRLAPANAAWNTWVLDQLPSWNLQTDIEDILFQFNCHPSQMHALPASIQHLVSIIVLFAF